MADTVVFPVGFPGAGRSGTQEVRRKSQSLSPQAEVKKEVKQASEHALGPVADIRLRFRVDPETHDVTVFVIDRKSQRVLRAIPPEEFGRLSEGELVHLLI